MDNAQKYLESMNDEDRVAIRDILIQWEKDGVKNPSLPMDVDVDGDGVVDAFALNTNGEVIIVSGVNLEDTVYESDGDDIGPEESRA